MKSTLLIQAATQLSDTLSHLNFSSPVSHIYNPLDYARIAHAAYLHRFANDKKRIIFLGMNPGPYGMTQTGVPFGEIASVRDWMGIQEPIHKPTSEHPKRPILGFDCPQSEVSGRRLWGLFAQRYGSPEAFFAEHFVANYCPLVFMSATGANITPDKINSTEMAPVHAACLEHLRTIITTLQPEWIIGVGAFAECRAQALQNLHPTLDFKIARILHPSPASPAANKDWAGNVTRKMQELSLWH